MRKKRLLIIFIIFVLFIFNTSIINASVPNTVLKQKDAVVTIIIYENDKPLAYGSGFIIDSNGIVATNYHVVSLLFEKQEASIAIKMANGEFIKAQRLLSINEEKDIALIQVESKGLPSVRLAKDYKPKQGDEVFVIGSPYGLETTVSNGIISSIRGEDEFLQITAPISGGSSGSPVFNANGEVTGIATLIIQGGQNINFAIPLKYITEIQQSAQNSKTETLKATVPPPAVKSVVENKVKSVDEHLKLAKEHMINNQWANAFDEYTKAISLNPENAFLYLARALSSYKKDKTDFSGIEDYGKAIALQPDNVVFYFERAKFYFEKEEYFNASKDLSQAIELRPNIPFLYSERCKVFDKLDANESAIDDCTRAINLKPDMQSYLFLNRTYLKEIGFFSQDGLKKQIKSFDAKKILADLYLLRASIYKKCGKINEQIKDYEKSVMLDPENSFILYFTYQQEDRLDEDAAKFYSHAITVYPKESDLYEERGNIYRKLKQYDKSLKDYNKAIELCPKSQIYYWYRAVLYNDLKQYDKAMKDYTTAIANIASDSKASKAALYLERGAIYLEKNEKIKAMNDFMKSCELSNEEACMQVKTIQKDINRGDKWVKYSESAVESHFYDKTSIKPLSKKYLTVWTRSEVKDIAEYLQDRKNNHLQTQKYENYSYELTRYQVDCSSEQIACMSIVAYNDKGGVINSYNYESIKMNSIVPDSMAQVLYKEVCHRKKK